MRHAQLDGPATLPILKGTVGDCGNCSAVNFVTDLDLYVAARGQTDKRAAVGRKAVDADKIDLSEVDAVVDCRLPRDVGIALSLVRFV